MNEYNLEEVDYAQDANAIHRHANISLNCNSLFFSTEHIRI